MTEADPEILAMAREEAAECVDRIERNLLAFESGQAAPEALDATFRDAHTLKGTAGMVGWDQASVIAHAMEDRLAECRDAEELPKQLVEPMLGATDALRKALDEGEVVAVDEVLAALREHAPEEVRGADRRKGSRRGDQGDGDRRAAQRSPSLRVAAEKVDRMLEAVGETSLNHRRLEHLLERGSGGQSDEALEEELDLGGRLVGELQDSVLQMRTLPLGSITASFPRAVRDLAIAEGKELELNVVGADTQLDRAILDGLGEQLTHLLRNAVAHGIETPGERERAGKPRAGTVELRAEQRGSMVAIEVSDDGRGVPAELITRAGAAGSLTDLLAAPGFSTAGEVSEVSGRGVGLDAVRSHVEKLGGSFEIRSEPTRGSTAIVLLPLTLALQEVLLCERAEHVFGLPVAAVREVIAAGETTSLVGQPSVEVRGEAIPLRDLAAMIGGVGGELPPSPPAMVLESPGRSVAVACDRVLGDREVVLKSLGPLLSSIPGYMGAAILEDGRVALIVDPSHLLKLPSRTPIAPKNGDTPEPPAPLVLVVDDQFTVRELQRSILETAGYRVHTACDGEDALERLSRAPDVEAVLTDVQMPNLDGFGLLSAIRRHPEHSSLPVVIVSSMGSDEDRRRGIEEGADSYIVKEEFDQRALLETIGRLVGREP